MASIMKPAMYRENMVKVIFFIIRKAVYGDREKENGGGVNRSGRRASPQPVSRPKCGEKT
jgi:hypothetical protein